MKDRSPIAAALAILVSLALAIPPGTSAQGAQRAGQVSRVIPAVNIQRGAQQLGAAAQTPVLWEDLVNTQRQGRARVALDDGSILSVGSESSLRVTKHDPGAQQTQLDLTYGRIRSKTTAISRPGGSFEVRTPAGVAGVVGTDFYLLYANGLLVLIVFEGRVLFCNLAGVCVEVRAGQICTIRGPNEKPDSPSPATPAQLTEAVRSTEVAEPSAVAKAPHHINPLLILGFVGLVAAPAIAVPLATRTKVAKTPSCPPIQPVCRGT